MALILRAMPPQIDLEPEHYRKLSKLPDDGEHIWARTSDNRTYTIYIAIALCLVVGQIWGAGELFSWRLWAVVGPSMMLAWALLLRFPHYFLAKLD